MWLHWWGWDGFELWIFSCHVEQCAWSLLRRDSVPEARLGARDGWDITLQQRSFKLVWLAQLTSDVASRADFSGYVITMDQLMCISSCQSVWILYMKAQRSKWCGLVWSKLSELWAKWPAKPSVRVVTVTWNGMYRQGCTWVLSKEPASRKTRKVFKHYKNAICTITLL